MRWPRRQRGCVTTGGRRPEPIRRRSPVVSSGICRRAVHRPAAPTGCTRAANLETREHYATVPYLYGEGNASLGAVKPDAVFVDDAARLTLVEFVGGGALTNYRGMKDIVETILLPFVHHLALVVPFVAHHTEPYRYYNRLTQALYAEQVVQGHLSGILVVGY